MAAPIFYSQGLEGAMLGLASLMAGSRARRKKKADFIPADIRGQSKGECPGWEVAVVQ